MKIFIISLFALELCVAATTCDSDDFLFGTECIACDKSPCVTCQGTGTCKKCPTNANSVGSGQCNSCGKGKLLINKTCVDCNNSTVGGEADSGDGEYCECSTENCCTGTGLYKDEKDKCYSCGNELLGCTKCKYENSAAKCSECGSDFKLDDGKCVWDSATHLFAVGGLLISLLILA